MNNMTDKLPEAPVTMLISQGQQMVIDKSDLGFVENFSWSAESYNGTFYVKTNVRKNGKWTTAKLHRLLLNAKPNEFVDHINGNPLDNRRSNLRIVTRSQNIANSKVRKDSTSGYKGISWNKSLKKWMSYIDSNKKRIHLGYYNNIADASVARKEAERTYHGQYAR
jgi:hypothetical protein